MRISDWSSDVCSSDLPSDRELLLLAGFDAFERLVAFESVDEGTAARCTVAPRRWRSLLGGGVRFVLMAHNHPSAVARPSRADIACTRRSTSSITASRRSLFGEDAQIGRAHV